MINESLKNAFKEMWKKNLNLLDISKSDLNSHISNDHPCYYAESSSIGGSAISAEKLDSSAGDSNTPVYFFAGKPVPCTSLDLNTSGNAAKATALTTSAGSATNPIYFSEGKPAACTYTLNKSVPSDAKFTDTIYSNATTSTDGLMSSSDKIKLDGIATGATKTIVDSALSSTSTNPVQNKVIYGAISSKADLSGGKVPSSQLPSYVDDVLEYSAKSSFPSTGETGKIYVDTTTNLTYRWSGSAYVEISQSLALGETSSTAYRGDRGKIAYDHTSNKSNPHGVTKSQVGLGNVDNTSDANKPISTATQTALNGKANASHTHNYAGSSSAGGSANSAVKLATARTIGLGTGAAGTATSFDGSNNITIPVTSVKEAYLSWGGKNFSGAYGPIDAAMVPDLGANRLAFMPAAGVEVQYSRDGGSTWSTYSTSDANKINLFNGNGAGHFIGATSATGIDKSKHQLRITITTNTAKVYTALNKFVIYCSTNGSSGSWCTIDAKTKANVDSGTDTWVTFANKVSLSGWSGYNVINTSDITTYGNRAEQYQKLRFTFGVTSHPSSSSYGGLIIYTIMGFGGNGWTTPSTMAATGRMYTYDASQNVTFPAAVSATALYSNSTKVSVEGHTHTVANISGLTATATELNYCDGVTSNIQTQLNNTVKLSGDQTIAGVKTFSNNIVANAAINVVDQDLESLYLQLQTT